MAFLMEMCFDRLRVAVPASHSLVFQYLRRKTWTMYKPVATTLYVLPDHTLRLDNRPAGALLLSWHRIEVADSTKFLAVTFSLVTAVKAKSFR
jgi:hypothetical protein